MKQRTLEFRLRISALRALAALSGFLVAFPPAQIAAQVPKRAVTAPVEETRTSNVRDDAKLFGAAAIAAAHQAPRRRKQDRRRDDDRNG